MIKLFLSLQLSSYFSQISWNVLNSSTQKIQFSTIKTKMSQIIVFCSNCEIKMMQNLGFRLNPETKTSWNPKIVKKKPCKMKLVQILLELE